MKTDQLNVPQAVNREEICWDKQQVDNWRHQLMVSVLRHIHIHFCCLTGVTSSIPDKQLQPSLTDEHICMVYWVPIGGPVAQACWFGPNVGSHQAPFCIHWVAMACRDSTINTWSGQSFRQYSTQEVLLHYMQNVYIFSHLEPSSKQFMASYSHCGPQWHYLIAVGDDSSPETSSFVGSLPYVVSMKLVKSSDSEIAMDTVHVQKGHALSCREGMTNWC